MQFPETLILTIMLQHNNKLTSYEYNKSYMPHWNILESDLPRERNSEGLNMDEDIHPSTIPQEGKHT